MDIDPITQARFDYHVALTLALAEKSEVQALFANYRTAQEPFVKYLRDLGAEFMGTHADVDDEQLVRMAYREAGRMLATKGKFPALEAAYQAFKIERTAQRNAKRNFLMENDMTRAYRENPDQMIYSSPAVAKISMRRLRVAYPPKGKWVCESEDIHDLWHYHLRYDPKADARLPRHEPVVIDHSKLKKIVAADESCIIRDEKNPDDIVLIVLRDFVTDMDVLPWLDEIIGEATSTRRNIRVGCFVFRYTVVLGTEFLF